MKKIKIISLLLSLILLCSIFFFGCIKFPKISWGPPKHISGPMREPFETAYTIEEHKQRLYELADGSEWIGKIYKVFEITDVSILYSFADVPEYFLVQRRYAKYGMEELNYDYVYGYIYKDEYYIYKQVDFGIYNLWEEPLELRNETGLTPYDYADISKDCKRYYGECRFFAWENADGQIEGYEITNKELNCTFVRLTDEKVIYGEKEIEELKQKRYVHESKVQKVNIYGSFW